MSLVIVVLSYLSRVSLPDLTRNITKWKMNFELEWAVNIIYDHESKIIKWAGITRMEEAGNILKRKGVGTL